MNTYITNKRLLPALALACLAPLASQNAQAAATFSSYATVTYTIDSIANLTNPGASLGLDIAGSFGLANIPDNPYQVVSGDGSVTPYLVGAGSASPIVGSSYSRTFQLDGAANDGGEVAANYLARFGLAFNNSSTTDYKVGLTLSYELSANASGDNAFTDVTLNYYNADETFPNLVAPDYIQAEADASGTANLSKLHAFNFTLSSGQSETLYVDAGITGTLQASPVPVPSAIWLFASALLAIPGITKSKRTVLITN